MPSVSERLTSQFYDWEKLGRGWMVYDVPVDLEPPFHPFFFHDAGPAEEVQDDGNVPGLLGRIGKLFSKPKEYVAPAYEPVQYHAFEFNCTEELVTFSVTLPKGHKVGIPETEQLLVMLSSTSWPVSFEIVAGCDEICIQIAGRESDAYYIFNQLKAFFPSCIVKSDQDLIGLVIYNSTHGAILDYGLRDEFMRPVAMLERLDIEPFIGLFASLEYLNSSEYVVIQVLFKGAANPWSESIMRSVMDSDGGHFFEDAPDMLPLSKLKIAYPFCGVTMKILATALSSERSYQILDMVHGAFGRIYKNQGNSLIPLPENIEGYDFELRVSDLIRRQSHRLGMLLNIRELATIVHLPNQSVVTPKFKRDTLKTKAAPAITEGNRLILGSNEHHGEEKEVTVNVQQRLRHMHLIGATGTGKSTLLHSLIVQDIRNGTGLAVLDPHGDLIESILPYIPEHRLKDVIIIDPSDSEFPVGFNILNAHSEVEKDILSSDLVAVFKRLSTSWGDQMNSVFANALLAFLESSQGGTLIDLRRFLVEKGFREAVLKTVSDPSIVYYWQKEFPLLKSGSIGPILTRLDTFLRPKLIRNMVAQKKSLHFESILDTQKILLIKLSHGLIGTENSYLLGTFFVSKMYQAATARQLKSRADRKEFFLYIDEFQNFITPSMSLILSGARKYGLGLILAHQDMTQLTKNDFELAGSVISNAGIRICFRLGDTDAKRFAGGFSFFESEDLENLNIGQAIGRIERPEYDFSLDTIPQPTVLPEIAEQRIRDTIQHSRDTYGTPKAEVEALLEQLREALEEPKAEPIPPVPEAKPEQVKPASKPVPLEEIPLSEATENSVKKSADSKHKYLQTLIKKMSESRGYKTLIEEPTPDGKGRVDVHLERNGRRMAVEICNTTEPDWEVHNLEKCANAGYNQIICCSSEKKSLENIKLLAEQKLDQSVQSKIRYFVPDELFQFLDAELAKEATKEVRVKGYRVKVEYTAENADVAQQKGNAIVKTVSEAGRKKK